MSSLPNLFVIGAQKAGTTSIYSQLIEHPEISGFHPKEPNIFVDGVVPEKRVSEITVVGAPGRYCAEGSINYTRLPKFKNIPENIAAAHGTELPRFIYMIRDPLDRAISHYFWDQQRYGQSLDFEAAIASDELYVRTSQYDYQAQAYLNVFPRSSIKFVRFETYKADPQSTLNDIFSWLELESVEVSIEKQLASTNKKVTQKSRLPWLMTALRSSKIMRRAVLAFLPDRMMRRIIAAFSYETPRQDISAETRAKLRDLYFMESIAKVEEISGLDLNDWRNS